MLFSKSSLLTALCLATVAVTSGQVRAATPTPTLTTVANFNGPDGSGPIGPLIADAQGNLFGTAVTGGAYYNGTVFEIAKTATGHASTPSTLVDFNDTDGSSPSGGLFIDANGDLFGTTGEGGAYEQGTVFEIAKTATGYASAPTTLVSFNGTNGSVPYSGVIGDAEGNLFGTTALGGPSYGTVFEIAKTASGYASTPTTLVDFGTVGAFLGADGALPVWRLIADANGDLFGTTLFGGAYSNGPANVYGVNGTVFEIAKTASGYASTPTTLVSFNGIDGASLPSGSLIADSDGNLFGTTESGGAYSNSGNGTVFEIAKTFGGYATTPTELVSFEGADGASPQVGPLLIDAHGNLFGITGGGGAYGYGTVFEIAKTARGYASTPTTLISFDGTNGSYPSGGLIADVNGDLFGATEGANSSQVGYGTVFKITNSGFVTCHGEIVSALEGQYGDLSFAATLLGYFSVQALQDAIVSGDAIKVDDGEGGFKDVACRGGPAAHKTSEDN